jgi:hypothetical protein
MKMESGEEQLHTFLTSSLDAYEWSASHPSYFTLQYTSDRMVVIRGQQV